MKIILIAISCISIEGGGGGTGAFAHNIIQFIKHSDLGETFIECVFELDDSKSKINDTSDSRLHSMVNSQETLQCYNNIKKPSAFWVKETFLTCNHC